MQVLTANASAGPPPAWWLVPWEGTSLVDEDRRLDECVAKLAAPVEEGELDNEREADDFAAALLYPRRIEPSSPQARCGIIAQRGRAS